MKPTDVVLCSGGLDSTVVIAELVESHKKPTMFFCDIGARACQQELHALRRIAKHYSLPLVRVGIDMPFLKHHTMFDKSQIIFQAVMGFRMVTTDENLYHGDWMIPVRNLLLLSAAATYCEYEGAEFLYTGFNNPGAASKDAQSEFTKIFGDMMPIVSERLKVVKVLAPLQICNKKETIERGLKVNAPIHLSYSCYNGFDKSCGMCPNCHSRLLAFNQLGCFDPIAYYTEKELRWIFGDKAFAKLMSHYDTEGLAFPKETQHEHKKG